MKRICQVGKELLFGARINRRQFLSRWQNTQDRRIAENTASKKKLRKSKVDFNREKIKKEKIETQKYPALIFSAVKKRESTNLAQLSLVFQRFGFRGQLRPQDHYILVRLNANPDLVHVVDANNSEPNVIIPRNPHDYGFVFLPTQDKHLSLLSIPCQTKDGLPARWIMVVKFAQKISKMQDRRPKIEENTPVNTNFFMTQVLVQQALAS
jgi:hypothetical protein